MQFKPIFEGKGKNSRASIKRLLKEKCQSCSLKKSAKISLEIWKTISLKILKNEGIYLFVYYLPITLQEFLKKNDFTENIH